MKRRAFTLIEVLVALGLILVLVTTMSSIIRSALRAREAVHERIDQSIGVVALYELLVASADTCTARGRDGAAGITGDSTTLAITRVAQHARNEGLDPIEELTFSFDNGNVVVTSSAGPRGTLLNDVGAIEFQYFDGSEFRTSWASAENGLPVAIQLSIWVEEPLSDLDVVTPDYSRLVAVFDAKPVLGSES